MKLHIGLREYKCVFCGKDYIQKSHLKHHVEKTHNQEYKDEHNIYGRENLDAESITNRTLSLPEPPLSN